MTTKTTHTDHELFQQIQEGDIEAFDTFYRRHFDSLYIAAFKRLQDTEACKDIIQDVFADCWQRRSQISNDNPVAYLHTAVRFQVFKWAARSTRQAFYQPFDEMSGPASEAADNLYYKELNHLVELWIQTLPEKRKQIFLLYYRESLSTASIAERLHISQKTVQNQLGIAFNDLRGKLPGFAALLIFTGYTAL